MISRTSKGGRGNRGSRSHESRGHSGQAEERKALSKTYQIANSAYIIPEARSIRESRNRWTYENGTDDFVAVKLQKQSETTQRTLEFWAAAKRPVDRPLLHSVVRLLQKSTGEIIKGQVKASYFMMNRSVGRVTIMMQ